MKPAIPDTLMREATEWPALHQWERKQLGLKLRRLGLTHSEIRGIIPVPKATLSNWSQEVTLANTQIQAIRDRTGPHTMVGIPRDTQKKRRLEIDHIRANARRFAEEHLEDSRFVGGVALYWGEGAKTRSDLTLSNADPMVLRAFVSWVRTYLDNEAAFVLSLHLHHGNDEHAAMQYWRREVRLPEADFTKTFIKPEGTGHRKNHLPHGVCRVRTRRSSDHWHRAMVWIDVVGGHLGPVGSLGC